MPNPRLIVLDVRLPFRNEKDLKAKPDEKEAFRSRILEAQKDRKIDAALAQLLNDHEVDGIRLQAYRQDPGNPFVHAKPHLVMNLDGSAPAQEVEQASGKSGHLVVTAHFPKRDKPWTEEELAKSTTHLVKHFQALGWVNEHCRNNGYQVLSARGQQYDDYDAVKHNSIVVILAAATVVAAITVEVAVILYVLSSPTIGAISPLELKGRGLVTVDGGNFEGVPYMSVAFNGHPVNFTFVSRNRFTTDLAAPGSDPRVTTTEISPITVTNSVSTTTSAATVSLFAPAPTIADFVPKTAAAGTLVDISGTNFLVTGMGVTFNGKPAASVSLVSDTQITAIVPAGSGVGPIRVATSGGAATTAVNFTEV